MRYRLTVSSMLLGSVVFVIALSLKPSPTGAVPPDLTAAAQANYSCLKTASDSDKKRVAASLSTQTSDKNALACAADLRFELTMASPTDLGGRVAALESLGSYIDLVHSLKDFDLLKVSWPEYELRLEHAQKLTSSLIPASLKTWPNNAEIMILAAELESALAGPNNPQITLAAIADLKKAVALSPGALNGRGESLIGCKYLALPPLFGGGAANAAGYLERARQIAPTNPRVLENLAEAYDELDRRADALRTLQALADAPPLALNLQLSADEWRMGEGLAARIGDTALSARFARRREELMRQHPEILLRKVKAEFGHGGNDPLTGAPQYESEPTNSR
jgi:tetratricopeptide (TPR) repeat protein